VSEKESGREEKNCSERKRDKLKDMKSMN